MSPSTVHPFRIDVPQDDLDDLHRRLGAARWPQSLPGSDDWRKGVPVDYLHRLADHWRDNFDWREQERRLNEFPQYTTDIDGQTIHFLHIRAEAPDATPLLLVHGWPGSFVEFLKVIGPLTDPAGHGAPGAPAFHVVVPSMPGFGFSGPTSEVGWTSRRIARAFAELMARLGYDRYGTQGGDFGAFVAPDMGRVDPDHVIGVHVNAATVGFIPFGEVGEDELAALDEVEHARLARMRSYFEDGNGYFQIQATRPQTVAYGLHDSAVGQLAWIVEKFRDWTNSRHQLPEDAVDIDQLLTNVSVYWFTGTAASAADLYYEGMRSQDWPTPYTTPVGVAVFAEDIAIRRYAEQSNTIVHWRDFDTGGHFAAMETPDLLTAEIRTFFASLV